MTTRSGRVNTLRARHGKLSGMAKLTVALATAFLLTITSATAASGQTQMPLIESQYNCSAAQAAFDGRPQPVVLGETATVQLAAECFLVVGVVATPGERLTLTYLSGQYDQINLAFYQPVARPGQAFGDPPDARLGTPTQAVRVPGSGEPQMVLIALQGVGGPDQGSAAIRIEGDAPPPATTVAPTTAVPVETTVAEGSPSLEDTEDVGRTDSGAVDDEGFPNAADDEGFPNAQDDTGFPQLADDVTGEDGTAVGAADSGDEPSTAGDPLPWWVVAITVLVAGFSATWLLAQASKRRRHRSILAPWDRPVVTWTMQHSAPTGSCSSNARAVVDPTDDGSLDGYAVSALFTLPASGKRTRSTIGDPLLAQLENLWLTAGSGEELRSAVDTFVNNLCRQLDQSGPGTDATLLVEMTKYDVAVDGDVYACTDGEWQRYPHWTQAPGVEADEYAQHNLVQVAALGMAVTTAEEWHERADELTEVIRLLIEERRAPVGLWVFH